MKLKEALNDLSPSGLVYEIVTAIMGAAIFTLLFIAFRTVASRAEP